MLSNTRPHDPADVERLRQTEGRNLLAGLADQRSRLRALADTAAQLGDLSAATKAEAGITRVYELIGKLCGELISVHEHRHIGGLLLSSDYHKLRQTLTETLKAHPAAARDVARALDRMEAETLGPPPPPMKTIGPPKC